MTETTPTTPTSERRRHDYTTSTFMYAAPLRKDAADPEGEGAAS